MDMENVQCTLERISALDLIYCDTVSLLKDMDAEAWA